MRYLLAAALLAATVAIAFSGCSEFRPGTLRIPATDEQHRLEKAYWVGFNDGADNGWKEGREAGLKAGKVILTGCPDQQVKIIDGKVKTDPDFQAASEEAVRQTDAQFCAKATEEWQRKAFCHPVRLNHGIAEPDMRRLAR